MVGTQVISSQEYRTSHGIGRRTASKNVCYRESNLKLPLVAPTGEALKKLRSVRRPKPQKRPAKRCNIKTVAEQVHNGEEPSTQSKVTTQPTRKRKITASQKRIGEVAAKNKARTNFPHLEGSVIITDGWTRSERNGKQVRRGRSRALSTTAPRRRKRRAESPPSQKKRKSWSIVSKPEKMQVPIDANLRLECKVCFSTIVHKEFNDFIKVGQCILVRSATLNRTRQRAPTNVQPLLNSMSYVARIVNFWMGSPTAEGGDGRMKVSVLWYYRPDQTALHNKCKFVQTAEVFASQHFDIIDAESIEDRCSVMPISQYSRYRKWLAYRNCYKQSAGLYPPSSIPKAIDSRPNEDFATLIREINPSNVYYCRQAYDFERCRLYSSRQLCQPFALS